MAPASLSAQLVEAGVAREATRGTPYECLHVALLDSTGKAIDHTVTDSAGRFLLEAPRPGVYRVQFIVFHWEPLVGPLDTLREGDFKQRAYPLAFDNMLRPDSAFGGPEVHGFQQRYKLFDSYLRAQESDGGWRSRTLLSFLGLHYPERYIRFGDGNVYGQFVVDSTGSTRRETWHTITATHSEFEAEVMRSIPERRWKPARNRGQPVCELTFEVIHFVHGDHGLGVWLEN